MPGVHVVTGAFSFTGAHVSRALLERGERVRTLSRRPEPAHPLAEEIEFAPLQFTDEEALTREAPQPGSGLALPHIAADAAFADVGSPAFSEAQ